MNKLTKKKLDDILAMINAGNDFDYIVEKKFGKSYQKKNEWLEKYSFSFTQEEKEILKDFYSSQKSEVTNVLQNVTEEKNTNVLQDITENTNVVEEENTEVLQKITDEENQDYKNTTPAIAERFKNKDLENKFLYLLDNIDELLKIGKRFENDLVIPKELLDLPSIVKSMRLSKQISDEFDDFCSRHKNYSKIQILNFVLREFMEKYSNSNQE